MTTDQQRIAIAKACGWTEIDGLSSKGLMGKPPNRLCSFEYLPNYIGDLNACQEMEKMLTYEQAEFFEDELCDIAKSANDVLENPAPWRFSVCHATASQRAEAFLRTLGLWQVTPTQPQ